jgi:hypothetical protein
MWHSINRAPWNGGCILTQTKKGVAKLTPPNCCCPLRDPVSFNHMSALCNSLDLTNTHDAAIWAVACTAWCGITWSVYFFQFFYTSFSIGELLVKSPSSFTPDCNITHNCPLTCGSAPNSHHFLKFKIPWTKTKLSAGNWISA